MKTEVVLWTIDEVARWIKVTPTAVRCMLKRREFPPDAVLHIGRRVRFRAQAVQDWALGPSSQPSQVSYMPAARNAAGTPMAM